jgi:hypothetical protein
LLARAPLLFLRSRGLRVTYHNTHIIHGQHVSSHASGNGR